MWSYKDDQYPTCGSSRIEYIIPIGRFSVIWNSKFQIKIALSTTEDEYIALSTSLKQSISFKKLMKTVC